MLLELTEVENYIIQLFFDFFPLWQNTLKEQIRNSKIYRTDKNSSYFINFNVERYVAHIPCLTEVPVQIILGAVDIPTAQVLRRLNGHIVTSAGSFFVQDEYALGVHIHFKSGYLCELEVYNLAGKKVYFDDLKAKAVTYIVT